MRLCLLQLACPEEPEHSMGPSSCTGIAIQAQLGHKTAWSQTSQMSLITTATPQMLHLQLSLCDSAISQALAAAACACCWSGGSGCKQAAMAACWPSLQRCCRMSRTSTQP